MTDSPGASCCANHDHSDHDHGPTGAQIVQGLIRGLSVLTLVIPAIAVVLLIGALSLAPATPLPLLVGLALGGFQLVVTLLISMVLLRTRPHLTVHPGVLALRSFAEEALRLGAVLLVLMLWPVEPRIELGVWTGLGAAFAWLVMATVQTVSTRRRLRSPSTWGKEAVATLLTEKVSPRSAVAMRTLDILGVALFQIGATTLVMMAPVFAIGTLVLSVASAVATLMLQRKPAAERLGSPWVYAPLLIGLMTILLVGLGIVAR